jgi:hypothetical protein
VGWVKFDRGSITHKQHCIFLKRLAEARSANVRQCVLSFSSARKSSLSAFEDYTGLVALPDLSENARLAYRVGETDRPSAFVTVPYDAWSRLLSILCY